MDVGLAILLFCCTGGIGFIIYIIIHFSKPEDRCVFCSQQTVPFSGQEVTPTSSNMYGQAQPSSSPPPISSNHPLKYCSNCGAKIEEKTKFCEMCGTELEK
ncbi:MAG: zinc-ribbon domain-containing protein [Promethearchaeota archaeon]